MNGIDLLIDTNIAIYVLEGYPLPRGLMQCAVGVSVISEMELLGKKDIASNEETAIHNLLSDCEILKFSTEIKDITIEIKKQFAIKLPDAIIAATAKYYDLPLVTADKGFKKLEGMVNVIILNI
jgi:predicted nucleic acid-binding protein